MNDVIAAKQNLTPQETIKYVSQALGEDINLENLCKLIIDGSLTLSVQLLEIIFAKKGKYAPFKQINYWGWAEKISNVREHKNINPLDMYQDKANKKGFVFENDIITIEPGRILDIPYYWIDTDNIDYLFSSEDTSKKILKLPVILTNGECFFKLLSPKNFAKDKIRKAIKKSKEGFNETELPNFVAINSKNFALDLAHFAEGIADPYNIEKKFFLEHSRLQDFEHRIIFARENIDKFIQNELKKRRLKDFNIQNRESFNKLAKLLSFELNQNYDEERHLKIENKKSFCIIINSLINEINELNKQNKLNMLNNKGYLKRAMRSNKDINAPLLADAAAAWDIAIGKDTIYMILREIQKLNIPLSTLVK